MADAIFYRVYYRGYANFSDAYRNLNIVFP